MAAITATIVAYGGADEIIAAVNSILAHAPEDFLLYLVDNHSPDDTAARLAEQNWDGRVKLICLEKNLGFGGGHNAVLTLLDSRYHFVLNPDILVDSPVLSQLAQWMEDHPQVVMATPQLYFLDGRIQHLPRRKPNFMGLLARQLSHAGPLAWFDRRYTMQDRDLTQPQEIQFCTGSFFCIRTQVYRKMGGFDQGYFMYVEDADITQKALQYGKVCLVPQFRAVHAWHRNPMRDSSHFKMQLKSMFRYWKKWGFSLF